MMVVPSNPNYAKNGESMQAEENRVVDKNSLDTIQLNSEDLEEKKVFSSLQRIRKGIHLRSISSSQEEKKDVKNFFKARLSK